MTGIRSWTAEVTALGVVVRIEQVFTHCPLASFQPSHKSGECEQLALIHFEAEWLLRCAFSRPFVEPICWNQTPTELHRIAKRRLRGGGHDRNDVNYSPELPSPWKAGTMARRRNQKGSVIPRGDSWELRWKEDVVENGELRRIHRILLPGHHSLPKRGESGTHVSGTFCYLCLRPLTLLNRSGVRLFIKRLCATIVLQV